MKRLILTRHAKSSWDDPLTPDHDRPLNDRGKAAAADLGQWLASRDYVPGEVLCSDALRTRKTFSGIADFAARLVAHPPVDLDFQRYPTGATLVVDFDAADWGQVAFGTGVMIDFIVPREIVA